MLTAVLLTAGVLLTAAQGNLLTNGDFEQPLTVGWSQEFDDSQGSYVITRDTTLQPDPDFEVRIYKYLRYYARLKQTVAVPGTNVRFSGAAKLVATKGPTSGYYAYAAIILEYQNAGGEVLGRTWIMKKIGDFNPQNTPTQHYILTISDVWENYGFVLADELANLPGINPRDISRVSVVVESYGTGASG